MPRDRSPRSFAAKVVRWTPGAPTSRPPAPDGNSWRLPSRDSAGSTYSSTWPARHLGRLPFESLDDDACNDILQINLRAVIDACRAALPHLRQSIHPAIVNTSSIAARSGGARGVAVYAAAKAGVEALTRSLAKEFGSAGIRVNAVAPGYIVTPIHEGLSTEDDRRAYVAATPLGRGGTAAECAGAYLFLACHGLSAFVTGQTVAVNGGLLLD